ncbi:MAG: methyltransferase domain-containing protein [Candidatus Omnitrophota bacterium]|nr:MAG: methyltransferase domain-containing protein [Candidatus Omnitrophota bacterium]
MMKKNFKKLGYYIKRFSDVYNYTFGQYSPKLNRMDYDDYWVDKAPFNFSGRYPVFAQIIEENSSVFDIGCGNGATLRFLKQKKNIKGEGVDVSHKAVEIARGEGIEASVADVSSPEFEVKKEYDYIIISEVLEHTHNPEDVIEKVKGKFNKLLIVSMPNIGHYMHRLRLLFGHFPIQWVYHPGEHLRFWTVKDFKKWVCDLGFQIVDMRIFSGVPCLRRLNPNLFADSVIFLLREREE